MVPLGHTKAQKMAKQKLTQLVEQALGLYNLQGKRWFKIVKNLVKEDYQDSNLSECELEDIVQIMDASGIGENSHTKDFEEYL